MKNGRNLRDLQQERKDREPWVKPQPCLTCKKVIPGAYGNHSDGWTCSRVCERTYDERKHHASLLQEQAFTAKHGAADVLPSSPCVGVRD